MSMELAIQILPDPIMMPVGEKKKRISLAASEKKLLCELQAENPKWTQDKISEKATQVLSKTINRSLVSKILKKRDRWMAISEAEASKKRNRAAKFGKIEQGLYLWFKQVRNGRKKGGYAVGRWVGCEKNKNRLLSICATSDLIL